MKPPRPITPSIGRQILEIVTAGMYSDPRMVYREFIQNAADSIDVATDAGLLKEGEGRIAITLDGERRIISVEDNGTGIPADEAEEKLGSLGNSAKEGTAQRGFRGIGRLGGLAHCDLLTFETRTAGSSEVAIVEWDGKALKATVLTGGKRESLADVVRRIARVNYRNATKDDPAHFFRATMHNVHRFHADLLMNAEAVREYLGQEAPVPFDNSAFKFGKELEEYLAAVPGFRSYDVRLNGLKIFRPYADTFEINDTTHDRIKGIEKFELKNSDGTLLGRGWYAKTSLLASLPRRCAMRGIRIRQGSISVGDEYLIEDAFTERRFATWHIGSIEVTQSLRPNARRDGFEETPTYERFLEQTALFGRHLSKLCRTESKRRVAEASVQKKLAQIEAALNMDFFVDEDHRDHSLKGARKVLADLAGGNTCPVPEEFESRLKGLHRRLEKLQGEPLLLAARLDNRKLQHVNGQDLLQRVCKVILKCGPGGDRMVRQVVKPFLKTV